VSAPLCLKSTYFGYAAESTYFGYAAGCEARLCLAVYCERRVGLAPRPAFGQKSRGKARTKGIAQLHSQRNGEAKPRLTSGGKAERFVAAPDAVGAVRRFVEALLRAVLPLWLAISAIYTSVTKFAFRFSKSRSFVELPANAAKDSTSVT